MIELIVVRTKKLFPDTTLNVVWYPSDESINELVYHSYTFPFGTPDSELDVYENEVAIPGMVDALNAYLGKQLYAIKEGL